MAKLSCSILSADFANLARDVRLAAEGGADLLHFDVMDGHFVPDITIGPLAAKSLAAVSPIPLDIHLMVDGPSRFLEAFAPVAEFLTVHLESPDSAGIETALRTIRALGAKPGLSIKPGTPLEKALPFLPLVDLFLVMSVEPGKGGQPFLPGSNERIRAIADYRRANGLSFQIEVDGGVNAGNIRSVADAGADILVAGSALFHAEGGPLEGAKRLKAALAAE